MSKLSLDLNTFKSAGVYTIEIDNSERITVNTQSLRLVPGFSAVGPFNVRVFIRSTNERQQYFGDIDTKLERKGSFFHRSIDTCLLSSPVFAINLLQLTDSDGNYKRRNGNRLALTSEYNMMLYDKAKSGQLDKQTYEELKKVIEFYEKLNPDERSKLNFETKRSIEEMKAIYKEFGLDKPTVVNNIINNNVNNITTLERDPRTYSDSGDMKIE